MKLFPLRVYEIKVLWNSGEISSHLWKVQIKDGERFMCSLFPPTHLSPSFYSDKISILWAFRHFGHVVLCKTRRMYKIYFQYLNIFKLMMVSYLLPFIMFQFLRLSEKFLILYVYSHINIILCFIILRQGEGNSINMLGKHVLRHGIWFKHSSKVNDGSIMEC
jgi:hypothetical protein